MINWWLANEMDRGVLENMAEVVRWYRASMERGDSHRAFCYADMLAKGKGVPRDPAAAIRYSQEAANAGQNPEQETYGFICDKGELGLATNFREAVCYFSNVECYRI